MVGVYSLNFHYAIAGVFGIDRHMDFNGRGFQAQAVRDDMRKQFGLE